MAKLQRRKVSDPSEVREVPFGRFNLFELGDSTAGYTVFEPGWRWSDSVKPIAGTATCQFHHLGFTLSGRAHVVMADGAELRIEPEAFFEIPPGHDAWVVGDEPWVSIDWGPSASYARRVGSSSRIVATLLFTDIVDSTQTAGRLGDAAWRDLLRAHDSVVRRVLERYGGREVTTTGDGFLVLFDGSERAVECARALCEALVAEGIVIRSGVHTGEVETESGNVRGLAVHVAARIMALAGPGEVLVSWTTRDLLDGSPLRFTDRGLHELKGLAEPRRVYALEAPEA